MKVLRITNCSEPMLWYSSLVGKVVDFVRYIPEGYISRESSGLTNIVLKDDAHIVDMDVESISAWNKYIDNLNSIL